MIRLLLVLAFAGVVAYVFLASLEEDGSQGLSDILNREEQIWQADPQNAWSEYLAPEEVCPGSGDASRPVAEQVKAMDCLINFARAKEGLKPVKLNPKLSKAASLKADLIVDCGEFSHTPCQTPFSKVFKDAGYGQGATFASVGENLAYGEDQEGSPLATVSHWLNSPEHRQNLLTEKWRAHGVVVRPLPQFLGTSDVELWVSVFGVAG